MMLKRWLGLIVIGGVALLAVTGLRTDPAERNNTGNALYARGEYEPALNVYQVAQVNAPDDAPAYYNAASALAAVGRLRDAAAALEQTLRNADEAMAFQAYYNLGNVLFAMARYNDAVLAYRQALRINPADEEARYNYELALQQQVPTPTPTPQEQQIDPEQDQADSTPTNNPAGQAGPTATPTPPPDSPPDEQATPQEGVSGILDSNEPSTPTPSAGGPLSIEDVERQLDAVQENQQTLREFLNRAATPAQPNLRDW